MNDDDKVTIMDTARECLGIFPQAIRQKDGTWKYRTPWEDGWNEAVIELIVRYRKISNWIATLPDDAARALVDLLKAEAVFLRLGKNDIRVNLILNDVFDYACSDAEEVADIDLPKVAAVYQEHGWDGLIAWVAHQRGEEPIKERWTDTYRQAWEVLCP